MRQDPSFHTIETSSRPAKVAVLLNRTDESWMDTCLRVIEWSTSVWGGWHSCLIPTDSDTIDERFWRLLERFDPDEILVYKPTGLDMEIANPVAFQARVEVVVERSLRQRGAGNSDGFPVGSTIRETGPSLSPALLDELGRRINSFLHGTQHDPRPINARLTESDFPLTDVSVVARNLPVKLHVTSLEVEASLPVQLMIYSSVGNTWLALALRLRRENADMQTQTLYPQDGLSDVLT